MTILRRLPSLFENLFAAAQIRYASHVGLCPHCERSTPWYVNALRGEYLCTECGRSPIGE